MDFVYKFAIIVSWIDHQRVDLVNAHRDNIFIVDLADNIAWVIVKMIDNKDCWGIRTDDPELGGQKKRTYMLHIAGSEEERVIQGSQRRGGWELVLMGGMKTATLFTELLGDA